MKVKLTAHIPSWHSDLSERGRAHAEIFATLANAPKLANLKEWQRSKLLEDAKECGLELAADTLSECHRWAHYLINHRLDDGRVDVSSFYKKVPHPTEICSAEYVGLPEYAPYGLINW